MIEHEQINNNKEKIIGETGVVVGKFYPPHRGHKYLIDTAAKHVDNLTVLVADKEGQTIPGELRAKWIQEIHPNVSVKIIPDIYPEDSKIWADATKNFLGYAPQVVFSSEDYGDNYAKFMGAKHVAVDKKREAVPICATKIREHPMEHILFLEPCVRNYYLSDIT